MIAFDTNILFPSLEPSHSDHVKAREFITGLSGQEIAVCELVLMETYILVRNPAVCTRPLDGPAAVTLIQTLRTNPSWRLIDYPGGSMNDVWSAAAGAGFPRRRVFDARLALTLLHHGVTGWATANTKDFDSFPFAKLWNPLA